MAADPTTRAIGVSPEIVEGALPHPALEERYLAPLLAREARDPYARRKQIEDAFRLGWRLRHQLEADRGEKA